jgi:alkanesulfonate monooxygenase SsuD/methylene tetrahydromethanopterin reductase-like flavin-dependent oxidoreductase (luciferase family)
MKIAAQLMPGDLPVFVESAKKAEESGFSRIYLVDGQLLWRNVFVYMTHGMAATEHIQFGTAVTNPRTRHYTVLANTHATLEEIHPGRVILGIGRGDNAVRTLGGDPVPTHRLKEIVPRLRELMAGKTVADEVELTIGWADQPDVPILMPATGPRNLRLAGALADIVMIQVGVNPVSVAWATDLVRAGAVEAGRDPADVEITMYTSIWVSEDIDEARGMNRWAAACAANHIEHTAKSNPNHGMPPELTRILDVKPEEYDYAGHLDPSVDRSEYPAEIVDDFGIHGTPAQCIETIQALADAGVDEIAPAYLNGRFEQMERVSTEIIPAFVGSPA